MKTCAEVLQVTIVVVTSNESVPWLLFVPETFSSEESIFVAFHFYGAGHYDSTRKAEEGKLSHDTNAKLNVFQPCIPKEKDEKTVRRTTVELTVSAQCQA